MPTRTLARPLHPATRRPNPQSPALPPPPDRLKSGRQSARYLKPQQQQPHTLPTTNQPINRLTPVTWSTGTYSEGFRCLRGP